MSLIIGVRCNDGCLVIADRRTHIRYGSRRTHRDDFTKVLKHNDFLVWNHGYNRIGNQDWKLHGCELLPDAANPVFAEVRQEMASKADRRAHYVFMNMSSLIEVTVCVQNGIRVKDHMPHDRIVSGSGVHDVTLTRLSDLPSKSSSQVIGPLEETFRGAHAQMLKRGGDEFSAAYDLVTLGI